MCSVHWEQGDGVPKEKVIYLKPLPESAALPLVSDSSLPHAALYLLHILPPIPSSHCAEVALGPLSSHHLPTTWPSPHPQVLHPESSLRTTSVLLVPPAKPELEKTVMLFLKSKHPPFYRRRSCPERASDLPKVTQELAEFLPSHFPLRFLLCSLTTLQESSGVSRNIQQTFTLGPLPPAPKETRDPELDAVSLPPCGCSPEYRLPWLALWKSCHRILTLTLTFFPAPATSSKIAPPT